MPRLWPATCRKHGSTNHETRHAASLPYRCGTQYPRERLNQNLVLLGCSYADAKAIGNPPGHKTAHDAAFVLNASTELRRIFAGFQIDEVRARGRHAKAHLLQARDKILHAFRITFYREPYVSVVFQRGDCARFAHSRNGKCCAHLREITQHLGIANAISDTQSRESMGFRERAQHDHVLTALPHVL